MSTAVEQAMRKVEANSELIADDAVVEPLNDRLARGSPSKRK